MVSLAGQDTDAGQTRSGTIYDASLFRKIGLFEAPKLGTSHKLLGVAALLGFMFVFTHIITIAVTLATAGSAWGMSAWMLDLTGFVAGGCFSLLCRNASNKPSAETRKDNIWILIWSSVTVCVRVLDVMMLFGIVNIPSIYVTPHGPTLAANIVSEVIIAFPYTLLAFVGSVLILFYPTDTDVGGSAEAKSKERNVGLAEL